MIKIRHAAAAAFVTVGLLAPPAFAAGPSGYAGVVAEDSQLTVTGHGKISAQPDVMRLQAGVEVRGATAAEVFKSAREAATKLTAALLAAGVAEKDLRTSDLSLGPEYKEYPTIAGYRATQGVVAVVRDMANGDQVIDAVAEVGEEARLHGVSFELSDPEEVLVEARDAAFANAVAKARQYAHLTGRHLGKIIGLREEGGSLPGPIAYDGSLAMADKNSISPGEQSVGVSVTLIYEMH